MYREFVLGFVQVRRKGLLMMKWVVEKMEFGKQRSRKKLALGMVWLVLVMVLSGCGSSGKSFDSATNDMKYESVAQSVSAVEEMEQTALADGSGAPQVGEVNRKLIKTVDMNVETKEFEDMLEGLNAQIAECGGYVENMNTYNGSIYNEWRSARSASMTIRIPEDKLDAFLGVVTKISNVVRRSDSVEDVTLTYVDLESHKAALETEQTRLLELLEMAETVEDIITIEERLSNVRYQIESMGSQLRTYDNLVSYSTVYLNIEEVKELTPVKEETVWERISGGFVESLHSVGDGFVEFGIWLIVNSPFLVIWAVIIVAVIVILRKVIAVRRKRQAVAIAGKAAARAQASYNEVLPRPDSVQDVVEKDK